MADSPRDAQSSPMTAQPKHFSRRKRVIIPVVVLVVVTVLATTYWYVYRRGYVSTNDAYIDGNPVTIGSKMLGRVAQLGVGTGDKTRVGQVLVQLDDTDLMAQEAQATAALAYTEQSVSLAKIGLDRAHDDFDRAQTQYKDSVITREQYDHARQALDLADAQYKVALSQVNTSKAQLGVVETQLKNTQIMSPIAGVVARKWVMPGEIVQPGQPIFTLYDLSDVWITANFEETKLGAISLGDPVRIIVDAYPGRELAGKVSLIGAAAASQFSLIPPNNASGNFTKVTQRVPVRISLDDTSRPGEPGRVSLLPGMSVLAKVRIGAK